MILTKILKKIVAALPNEIEREIYFRKNRFTRASKLKKWEDKGRPVPPPHQYKQKVVEEVGLKYKLPNLIETGTFLGHMVEAQRKNFKKILSVELDPTLYSNATKQFENYDHIKIFQGDSSNKIVEMIEEVPDGSIVFWLDGHYSGGITAMGRKLCPIYAELTAIFNKGIDRMYILIDDARLFVDKDDYPTLIELKSFINKQDPTLTVDVVGDIIHVHNFAT